MIDPANIVFIIAFIVLPVTIGIWALMTRRDLLNRYTRRQMVPPASPAEQAENDETTPEGSPEAAEQPTESIRVQEHTQPPAFGFRQQSAVSPIRDIPAQETVQMPGVDQVGIEPALADRVTITHRVLRFPQYRGRSAGVVKRLNVARSQRTH
jgi:hypothetical protein